MSGYELREFLNNYSNLQLKAMAVWVDTGADDLLLIENAEIDCDGHLLLLKDED